jgi:hypothetical protein
MRLLDRVKDGSAFVVVLLVGAALAAAVFFLGVIPAMDAKKREKARAEAEALAKSLRDKLAAAKAERDRATEAKVEAIQAEAKAQVARDSVDVANDLIADAMRDSEPKS